MPEVITTLIIDVPDECITDSVLSAETTAEILAGVGYNVRLANRLDVITNSNNTLADLLSVMDKNSVHYGFATVVHNLLTELIDNIMQTLANNVANSIADSVDNSVNEEVEDIDVQNASNIIT